MILITRPKEDSIQIERELRVLGFETLIDPMIEILPVEVPSPEELPGVAIYTSRNGIQYCPHEVIEAQPQVFTVGESTYETAKLAGFKHISCASGDVDALYQLILRTLPMKSHRIIHFCGKDKAGNLVQRLIDQGYNASETIVYNAKAANKLADATLDALSNGVLRTALFFSPRTASIFMSLIRNHHMNNMLNNITAICISNDAVSPLQKNEWCDIKLAEKPTKASLLELIK